MGWLFDVFGLLTSGAGGGIIGGVFALFKGAQELKEKIAFARIEKERDEMEYENAREERAHQVVLMEKGAQIELEKIQTETEAEVDIANQAALSRAQGQEFKLKTTSWMDNLRASVRPVLAYTFTLLFIGLSAWSFVEFASQLNDKDGKELLLMFIQTLTFTVTAIVTFYYVARRNTKG